MWAAERTEDPTKFRELIYEPIGPRDPENVSQEVVEDEMAAFKKFTTETRG